MSEQTIRVVPTVIEHWVEAKPRMVEVMEDPYRDDSIRHCPSITLLDRDDDIIAIVGMAKIRLCDVENYIWMYGTPLIYKYPKSFYATCKRCLQVIPDAAWAWVNEHHGKAVRMAEELGFRPTPVLKTIDYLLAYRAYTWRPS
jgi:hypothetical protein